MLSSRDFKNISTCHVCGDARWSAWTTTTYRHYVSLRSDIPFHNVDPLARNEHLSTRIITLKQCRSCGFVYASPQIDLLTLSRLYNEESSYFMSYVDTTSPAHINRQKEFGIEIRRITSLAPGKKILDVGCGGGYFLERLGPSWDRTGIEIDPLAVKTAKRLLGKNVRVVLGNIDQSPFPKRSFDAIVIRGTIEHVPNPRATLTSVASLLKRGGIAAINTQNIDSPAAQLYRGNFRLLDPIHHIWNFSPKTLTLLLDQVGLHTEVVDFNYFNTPYFRIRDILTVGIDALKFAVLGKRPTGVSPPFYGNIMDVYARK